MIFGQLRQELNSINLDGKTKNQIGNWEILVNWAKGHNEKDIVAPGNLREFRKRIKGINKNIISLSETAKSKIEELHSSIDEFLTNLYCRWQDEKEYEDWNDYVSVMKQKFETLIAENNMSNAVYYSCGKRPFGIKFDFEGFRITLYVNSTSYGWKSKQL